MKYTYEGTVLAVGETKTFGATFTKREVVMKSGTDEYPRGIPFEFTREETAMLDGVNPGDRVQLEFYVEGSPDKREQGSDRFYPSLHARKITVVAKATGAAAGAGAADGPATWAAVVETWKETHPGEDKTKLQAFIAANAADVMEKAKAAGKKFTDLAAATPGTFEKLIAAMKPSAAAATGDQFDDDMPF